MTIALRDTNGPARLVVSGAGFAMQILGRGSLDEPLGFTRSQVLIIASPQEPVAATGSVQARSGTLNEVRPVVVISGSGFRPLSDIKVYVLPDVIVGEVVTDANGAFDARLSMPPNIPVGVGTLQMDGFTADGIVQSVSIGVAVEVPGSASTDWTDQEVFFAPRSAVLTPDAKTALRSTARAARGAAVRTEVRGYVQGTNATGNDEVLSGRRARAVAAYLRALGVAGSYIVMGEGRSADAGALGRCAEISIAYRVG